jgi:hypothetical protein
MEARIQALETENASLKTKIEDLEKRLAIYTNNQRHKKYYEEHKDEIKEKANQYLKKLATENPEKLKEYRHRAYLKQKEKKNNLPTQG